VPLRPAKASLTASRWNEDAATIATVLFPLPASTKTAKQAPICPAPPQKARKTVSRVYCALLQEEEMLLGADEELMALLQDNPCNPQEAPAAVPNEMGSFSDEEHSQTSQDSSGSSDTLQEDFEPLESLDFSFNDVFTFEYAAATEARDAQVTPEPGFVGGWPMQQQKDCGKPPLAPDALRRDQQRRRKRTMKARVPRSACRRRVMPLAFRGQQQEKTLSPVPEVHVQVRPIPGVPQKTRKTWSRVYEEEEVPAGPLM
jgi:hypothetical protein